MSYTASEIDFIIKNKIEQTNITKMMYNNNVLLKIINRNIKV